MNFVTEAGMHPNLVMVPQTSAIQMGTTLDSGEQSMDSINASRPAKRHRSDLSKLTPSEKLERRRWKNKIAAQTARDRRKTLIQHLEQENRKLRIENELLKVRLQSNSSCDKTMFEAMTRIVPQIQKISQEFKQTNSFINQEANEIGFNTDNSQPENLELSKNVTSLPLPISPSAQSSTSGAFSASTTDDYQPTMDFGETDEVQLVEDVLQLHDTFFNDNGKISLESAELINVSQPKRQGSSRSSTIASSIGWTSIQLMLLSMITRTHVLYLKKTECCAPNLESKLHPYDNLFDIVYQSKCSNFRQAAEAIISNKSNLERAQVAFNYVYRHIPGIAVKI